MSPFVPISLTLMMTSLLVGVEVHAQAVSERQYLSGTDKDHTLPWEFYCTGGQNSGVWTTIPVPSCWETEGFGNYRYGTYSSGDERGLYRLNFSVPTSWDGRHVYLVFEGVMTDATVTLNGHSAGPKHQGAFYQFRYDVSNLLDYSGDNLLEVTVDKTSADTSVNEAERQADYWVFGGIFRPVYLLSEPIQSIDRLAVDAQANGSLTVRSELLGITTADRIVVTLLDDNDAVIATLPEQSLSTGTTVASTSAVIGDVDLWSPEFPNLYTVRVELFDGTTLLHSKEETVGFRTFEIRPDEGLYLNGKRVFMRGVNRHAFWPDTGRTTSPELDEDDVRLIKDLNMNAVRMSHYPPDSSFLEACDRLGLLVLNELAGWQDAYSTAAGEPLVREMVLRDRNHPSIVWWSNGNEGGHNMDLVDDFAKWDVLQKRPVIISTNSSGPILNHVKTQHYPDYSALVSRLQEPTIYMPTEMLHGLYDGGHGAGFEDYWGDIRASSHGGGFFLWNLSDEGVVRTDQGGALDTDGNRGADGITGPYRELEASFYTLRRLLSPIQVNGEALPAGFDGNLQIENRYAFTNLSDCQFDWELLDLSLVSETVAASGTAASPSVAPGASGTLALGLPADFAHYDALRVHAFNPHADLVESWTWPLLSRQDMTSRMVQMGEGTIAVTEDASFIDLAAAGIEVRFRKDNGRLERVIANGGDAGLGNGPRVVSSSGTDGATLTHITHGPSNGSYVVEASYQGDLSWVRWTFTPSGWLGLEYGFISNGPVADAGIAFDYPENGVESLRWIGRGPDRVWQNRLQGPDFGHWSKEYNTTRTGREWNYPEFKGYHLQVYAAELLSENGLALGFVLPEDRLYLRLFSPDDATGSNTGPAFPEGDIGFMHAIPGVGTKFKSPSSLGPSSQLAVLDGENTGSVWFHFEGLAPRPEVYASATVDSGTFEFATSSAFHDPSVVGIVWNFGDGSPDRLGAGNETAYTYISSGSYIVTATALGAGGNVLFIADTEVQTVGAGGPGNASGLLARWGFDNPLQPGVDDTQQGHDLIAGAFATVPGQNSSAALTFESASHRATNTSIAPAINGLDAITVAVWVRAGATGLDSGFLAGGDPGGADDNLGLRYDASGWESGGSSLIKASLRVRDTANQLNELNLETPGNTQTSGWQHLTLAWQSGQFLKLYIDGLPVTPAATTGVALEGTVAGVTKIVVGEGVQNAGIWPGDVDDLRIYGRALSPSEVAQLPTAGPPSVNVPPTCDTGPDVVLQMPKDSIVLSASANDPDSGPDVLETRWEAFSGPGAVTFSDPSKLSSTVTFTHTGEYVLRLIAHDGATAVHNFLRVTVKSEDFNGWAARTFADPSAPEAQPSADFDSDGDSNAEEFISGSDPTDPASRLRVTIIRTTLGELELSFRPVIEDRQYRVRFGTSPDAMDQELSPEINHASGQGTVRLSYTEYPRAFFQVVVERID